MAQEEHMSNKRYPEEFKAEAVMQITDPQFLSVMPMS